MPELDPLFQEIKTFVEQRKKERTIVESTAASKAFGATKVEAAGTSEAMYTRAFKAEAELNKIMKDRSINLKKAIDIRKKDIADVTKVNNKLRERYEGETKVLNILEKQYRVRQRAMKIEAMSKKIFGRPATAMGKFAITGEGARGLGKVPYIGMASRIVSGVGAVIIGSITATTGALLSVTISFAKTLTTIWDQGIKGILQSSVNFVSSLASVFSDKLGGLIQVIGGLLIRMYMMHLEDWIAGQRMGVRMLARTGREGGEAFFGSMMESTGKIRALAIEWGSAALDTSSKVTADFAETFFRVGRTMDLTAQETSGYYQSALVSASEDITKATDNVLTLFGKAKKMAKDTGISSTIFAKSIADASVQARMFNVDMKSVANTMGTLTDKQKTLGAFGVELRSQGDQVLKALVTAPEKWSMALHAFAGREMFGTDYMRETGKQMGTGFSWMASRFGIDVAKSFKMTEAGAIAEKAKETGGVGLVQKRLDMMIHHARKHTASISDEHDQYMAQHRILEQLFGVTNEQARISILSGQDTKKLAKDTEVQLSLMSTRDIAAKTYSIQEREEQIQRAIAAMVPVAITLLRLLPDKLASIIKPGIFTTKEEEAAAQVFDEVIFGAVDTMTGMGKHVQKLIEPLIKGWKTGGILRSEKLFSNIGLEDSIEKMEDLTAAFAKGELSSTVMTEYYKGFKKAFPEGRTEMQKIVVENKIEIGVDDQFVIKTTEREISKNL